MTARAVVFAYHDVGARCLEVLLRAGVEVPLVVTSKDDPSEQQWFANVARTATDHGLTVATPDDPNSDDFVQRVLSLQPDFLFSFYYRSMLSDVLLKSARRGALNMHGSLLPKYRGRAPVNWAILRGERETGVTLHYMVARADAGDIVDQLAVPIFPDDDARQVFERMTAAAQVVLARSLPGLLAGTAPRRAQAIEAGQYFGRRRPEDGRIDWRLGASEIHNLVRAVAPPFPGAFADIEGRRVWIHRTQIESAAEPPSEHRAAASASNRASTNDGQSLQPGSGTDQGVGGYALLHGARGGCYVTCADGAELRILAAATDAGPIDLVSWARDLERRPIALA